MHELLILLLINPFIIQYIVYRLYIFQPSEMKKLTNKADDPPRLVFVQGDRAICNAYVIAGGIQMEVNTNLRDALVHLLYAYYAWDLSYPKNYLLLGFLQVYVLNFFFFFNKM